MQTGLQPLQHRCGIALLPTRLKSASRHPARATSGSKASLRHQGLVKCLNSESRDPKPAATPMHTAATVLFAAALTVGNFTFTHTALAKSSPPKKSDPYEELQNIINSRGGNSSNSLLENFQKSVKEAAKLPAEILKDISPPTQPSTPAPAIPLPQPLPPIPVPITKALPQPDSKAAAASKSGGGSTGLLAAVGALVVAAGFALNTSGGSKSATPKPNKIKAKIKGGTQQVSKQASKPSFSFPSLGGKASQVGKAVKGGTKQVSKQAPKPSFSFPSLGGKASQVGKTVKGGTQQVSKQASKPSFSFPSLGGKASQVGKTVKGGTKQMNKQASKPSFSLPSLGGKAQQVGRTAKVKAGSAPQKAKKAISSGTSFFGTGSTRGKNEPAKKGGGLGTRSTRPGNTQKVKVSAGKSATAAKNAVKSGGKSLADDDTKTTVGALGVVGLALAVGALTLSSITSSIGGGGGGAAGKAPEPVKQLLDRVPQPLPVRKLAEQAATQVTSKAQEAVPQSAPSLELPSPPQGRAPSIQPPPIPSPKDTLPPVAQTPQTPSGPDLVPELMQKPKTGAPLAPPPSDATKPKIPSGPDLRVPGPPSPSLGMTPQLATAPSKAASKAASKVSEAVPQLANAPSADKVVDKATSKVAEAAPGPSAGSPAVLLGLTALVAGGVLLAKQTQPQSDGKSGGGRGGSPSASKGAAASSAPQSAEEAAADAKQRAKEAREWIDNWKSKQ